MRTSKGTGLLILLLLGGLLFTLGFPGSGQAGIGSVAQPFSAAGEEYVSGEILVRFKPDAGEVAPEQLLQDRDEIQMVRTLLDQRTQLWSVPAGSELALASDLQADPRVEFAEPNYIYRVLVEPDDPELYRQWGLTRINAPAAWDIETGDSGVVIAVLDTGVDETHPDLSAKLVPGWDFANDDADPHDGHGHGTHVAGIAAAATNNDTGIAGLTWGARIMPVQVMGADGTGSTADILEGVLWAAANGARIINLSVGGEQPSAALQAGINDVHNAGRLVVAAMGNERLDGNPTNYPAAYSNVLAVSATTFNDNYAYYSNYGDHNDLAAPGGQMYYLHDPGGIYSTMPTYNVYMNTAYGYSKNYDYVQGTSQATPYVSGLAALIWSVNPGLTPDEVQGIMEATAVDLGPAGWDPDYGWGRIDALAALQAAGPNLTAPALNPITNADLDGNYSVSWSSVYGAETYRLEVASQADFGDAALAYLGPNLSLAVSNQDPGTWYYRVRAEKESLVSDWSNAVSVVVIPAVPNLNPIDNSDLDGSYTVSWSAVAGVVEYRLQVASLSDFSDAAAVYLGPDISTVVAGQAPGLWYYRVRAENGSLSSSWSAPAIVGVAPPAPVLDPIANPTQADEYTLSWSAAAGATGYRLEEAGDPAFSDPLIRYEGASLSYALTGQTGGDWYYRVSAYNAVGSGPASGVQSTIVLLAALDAPLLAGIANPDMDGSYDLSWSAVPGATGYLLEASPEPFFVAPEEVYRGPLLELAVADQPLGDWYYRVRAFGVDDDRSPWSLVQGALVRALVHLPLVVK